MAIEVTSGSVVETEIGTTAPFSAISGASRLTLSETSGVLPAKSVLIASAAVFWPKASFGHLAASAAARAGLRGATAARPHPAKLPVIAPCTIRRRVSPDCARINLQRALLSIATHAP